MFIKRKNFFIQGPLIVRIQKILRSSNSAKIVQYKILCIAVLAIFLYYILIVRGSESPIFPHYQSARCTANGTHKTFFRLLIFPTYLQVYIAFLTIKRISSRFTMFLNHMTLMRFSIFEGNATIRTFVLQFSFFPFPLFFLQLFV